MLIKKFNFLKDDVNIVDINKRTPLHWACAHGNFEQAKMISKLGQSFDNFEYFLAYSRFTKKKQRFEIHCTRPGTSINRSLH